MSSTELPGGEPEATQRKSFEETYPQYEFAELVRLALVAGAWLVKGLRRLEAGRLRTARRPLSGQTNPAE